MMQFRAPRLSDVAERAGVSIAVASVALRGGSRGTIRVGDKTAEKVRRVARRMQFRPNMAAQMLKGRKHDVIGVMIGAESTAANYGRLAAIEREAYGRGYRLMIGQFHNDAAHTAGYINDFLSRGIGALVCFHNPLMPSNPEVMDLLAQTRALVFQTVSLVQGACCVDVDRAAGVREAVTYLLGRGRRRVALALNAAPETDSLMEDRRRGYLAGVGDPDGERSRSLIWSGTGEFPPSREVLDGAVDALVVRGGADAIVASNDIWAVDLIKALRRRGLDVPGEVAVVGFDNLEAGALFDPSLTTIDQNNVDFARAAVDLLLATLDGKPLSRAERTRVVQPKLVVRESA
ncbi:MAG: LacI family transcriptional regulator [Verrucomicrobia bacterium]|jgi:DNA-binding LacI/PurR family transcriptional regulator|nr:LacI family transcriptional regulator [Verrucomicrobiota bacterium]